MDNRKWTDEQRAFLGIIRKCRRRMNVAQIWEKMTAAVIVGAVFGLGFEVAAFILPFYYVHFYAFLAVAIAALTGLFAARMRRVSEAAAALKIDSFGFEERVVTAYEGLTRERCQGDPATGYASESVVGATLFYLQQKDAIRKLMEGKDRIKIRLSPSFGKICLCIGLLVAVIVLAFVPSAVKERAKELHAVKEESLEKQKEIENIVEELEEFASEELSEEQLAALQEMIKSLESSSAEYGQASSAKALSAASQKLDYKYADISEQLAKLAESIQNGAAVSTPTTSAMRDISQELQNMSGSSGDGNDTSGEAGEGGSTDGSGDGSEKNNGSNSGDGQKGEDDGQDGSAGDGNGTPNGNGNSGDDGSGSGSGNSSQNGNGSNGSNGSGGSDKQNGNPGGGRGTGSVHVDRDYISVPNDVGNDETLTGQAGSSEYSESFKAPNGLAWEGDHVSYDSVIGEYQQKAYEGISNGKYPSGMENVIRDYFGSFNE